MNQTIYFRKDVWELFETEPKKSDLINRLLEEHYTQSSKNWVARPSKDPVIKNIATADAVDKVKDLFPQSRKLCKVHGTPLTLEGKCLQKGH